MLKYNRRTMCTLYKCQKAAKEARAARLGDGEAEAPDEVSTFCFEVKEIIGQRFADPEQLEPSSKPLQDRGFGAIPASFGMQKDVEIHDLIEKRRAAKRDPGTDSKQKRFQKADLSKQIKKLIRRRRVMCNEEKINY